MRFWVSTGEFCSSFQIGSIDSGTFVTGYVTTQQSKFEMAVENYSSRHSLIEAMYIVAGMKG